MQGRYNSNSTADGAENTGGADDNTVGERDSGAAWKSTKRRKGRRKADVRQTQVAIATDRESLRNLNERVSEDGGE